MTEHHSRRPVVLLPEVDPVLGELQHQLAGDTTSGDRLGADIRFSPMTLDEAAAELNAGRVDVVVAGLVEDSATVLRAAIKGVNRSLDPANRQPITSFFVMERGDDEPIFLADCAVHEYPNAEMLVTIAEQTVQSVQDMGIEPVVAFLSLSSFGSAAHLQSTQKVAEAFARFKADNPDIISYGEIQADAATNPVIFVKKAQKAGVELIDGKMPNVFILPDGVSGNIVYKMIEQLAGYVAVGPMLNGILRDMHDLSRGATAHAVERSIYYAALLHSARQARRCATPTISSAATSTSCAT